LRSKRPYFLLHIIGWLAFLGFQLAVFPHPERFLNNKDTLPYITDQLVVNGIAIAFFYINYYILLPKYYFEKKAAMYTLLVVSCLLISVAVIYFMQHAPPPAVPTNSSGMPEFSENPLAPPSPAPSHVQVLSDRVLLISNFIIKFFLALLLSVGIRIYNRWQRAEEEKYKAELSFLKAQINPHFLFNTLNGIYVLATRKAENTAPAIMKLSSIMRYVISEGHHNYVSLHKELGYISDYIDLQKMRLSEKTQVDYKTEVDNNNLNIAPLILIPFIENAFKHGISTEKLGVIRIHILVENGKLQMEVENNKYQQVLKEEEKSGIGVNNTRKRLELLYTSKFELITSDTAENHKVILKMNLA
jgi:hypothetical protein